MRTWPDFEKLFTQGHGWDFCACMLFQRGCHLPASKFPTRAEHQVQNLAEKKRLVQQGRAHGILVYANGEPVGWCQCGPVDELPILGYGPKSSRYPTGFMIDLNELGRERKRPGTEGVQWRITCYVTNKGHRKKGVATIAYRAALESIGRKGGGLVEALMPGAWTRSGHGRAESVQRIRVEPTGRR
jgi:hypothetical protein